MPRSLRVLLVEDNPSDLAITRQALADSKLRVELAVAADGMDALAYLRRTPLHDTARAPDLLLVDLELQQLQGLELLAELNRDVTLRAIPAIVVASSCAERDIARSYDLGACCYVTKPLDVEAFRAIVASLDGLAVSAKNRS